MENKYYAIGTICNYYGGLYVMQKDGKYYWLIENYSTDFNNIDDWGECDKELYDSLIAYENRRNKPKK